MPESPRSRLLKNLSLANKHYGIVHGPDFQAVADLAMLQVVKDVTDGVAGAGGVDAESNPAGDYAFIAGAQYMLQTLQNIANSTAEPKEVQRTDRLTT